MEIEIIKALQSVGGEALDIFCKIISHLSSYIGFIFWLVILFIFYKKIFAVGFGITYGIGVGFNYLLKHLINRPRPYVADAEIINKMQAMGQSFPSGHALSATMICCFLVYWIVDRVKNKWLKVGLISLLCVFLLLVIFSRMYLGQHYLSDTIAGVAFGLIYSAIALILIKKKCKNK